MTPRGCCHDPGASVNSLHLLTSGQPRGRAPGAGDWDAGVPGGAPLSLRGSMGEHLVRAKRVREAAAWSRPRLPGHAASLQKLLITEKGWRAFSCLFSRSYVSGCVPGSPRRRTGSTCRRAWLTLGDETQTRQVAGSREDAPGAAVLECTRGPCRAGGCVRPEQGCMAIPNPAVAADAQPGHEATQQPQCPLKSSLARVLPVQSTGPSDPGDSV